MRALSWIRSAVSPAKPASPPTPAFVEAARLETDRQWADVEQSIAATVALTASVRDKHTTAATQLDAAAYAMSQMMSELSSVMASAVPAQSARLLRMTLPVPAAAKSQPLAAQAQSVRTKTAA